MTADTRPFRRAEMIELHQAGVIVHTDDYHGGLVGWREYADIRGGDLTIDGEVLGRLLQDLGLLDRRPGHIGDYPLVLRYDMKTGGSRGRTNLLGGEGGKRIKGLWARVESERLLEIRFIEVFDDGQEAEQGLTYCGSYTVWWSPAEEPEVSATEPEG